MEAMQTDFYEEFNSTPTYPWATLQDNKVVGTVRSAGTSGNITFVTVHGAGLVFRLCFGLQSLNVCRHMVPFDQPEAALVSALFPDIH